MIALLCGGIDDSAAGGSSHDSSLASDVVDNNFGRRRHQFGYFGKKRRMSLLDLFVANTSFILWLMIVRGRRGESSFYFVLHCFVFQAPQVSQAKHTVVDIDVSFERQR